MTLTVVVIIPLVEERDYFYEVIKGRRNWDVPKTKRRSMDYTFESGTRKAKVLVRTIEKMGQLEAVLAMNAAASLWTPELVILVGLAGSMDPQVVGYGDVVVSNQVKTYAPNKIGTISSSPKADPFYHFAKDKAPSGPKNPIAVDDRDGMQSYSYHRYQRDYVECGYVDPALASVERHIDERVLKQLDVKTIPKKFETFDSVVRDRSVQYGWIFGSDYVVDSKEYRDYLNDKDKGTSTDIYSQLGENDKIRWKPGKLLALDMESYGVLKAVETLRTTPSTEGGVGNLVGGIVVRGISDMAESKGESDLGSKDELRRLAVHNAAEVTAQIIERLDYGTVVRR